jgi:hypothetical protein
MPDHPPELALGTRDVIGAWLVCFAFGAACLAVLGAAAPEPVGAPAALINPGAVATVAAANATGQGRC